MKILDRADVKPTTPSATYSTIGVATIPRRGPYVSVRTKFTIAVSVSCLWVAFSAYLAMPWINDLTHIFGRILALGIVVLIALMPGFMNAFLVSSLLLDRRPRHIDPAVFPGISVLVAAFNEEGVIVETVTNILRSAYPGPLEVIVIDDGSSDATLANIEAVESANLRVIREPHGGKAKALNAGLAVATYDLVLTVDADTYLFKDAIQRLVARIVNDPVNTAAVAGAVLVRNSRDGFIAKMQEWDYFHGISSVKRSQSLFQGTLVAQGAFSIYRKAALLEVGGWPDKIGEDIVLTWALLEREYRVGYAEDAIVFTNVPTTYKAFFNQRRRWSRGLIEAFRTHPNILLRPRMTTLFIYWNALFPVLDIAYVLIFIPGVIAALLGNFAIAGPATLAVLPLALGINLVMFLVQRPMFDEQGLKVRRNLIGFVCYMLVYSIFLEPATIVGYFYEFFGARRSWGTK